MKSIIRACALVVFAGLAGVRSDISDYRALVTGEAPPPELCEPIEKWYIEVMDVTEPGDPVFASFYAGCLQEHNGFYLMHNAAMVIEEGGVTRVPKRFEPFHFPQMSLPVTQAKIVRKQ
jgi:hypothetical protein